MQPEAQTGGGGETRRLLPMFWVNRTDAQFAPVSTRHIQLTRERMREWDLPIVEYVREPRRAAKFIMVGASSYVRNYIEEIRELSELPGARVFAINFAHNLVLDHGIRLDGTLLFEGGRDNHVRKFRLPQPDVTYYAASWCHPHQFEKLRGNRIVLWHAWSDFPEHGVEYAKFPGTTWKDENGQEWLNRGEIGGGATTFTRCMNLGFFLGYRDFELFGFDSSFEKDGETHCAMSDLGRTLPTIEVVPGIGGEIGPTFHSKAFLVRQVQEFRMILEREPWASSGYRMQVHGPGLLPYWHRKLWPHQYPGPAEADARTAYDHQSEYA